MIRAVATGLNRRLRRSTQVVGGGTLVGRLHWRILINRGLKLTKNNGSYAIGVGVEDPVFVGRNSGSSQRRAEAVGANAFEVQYRLGARAPKR